MEILKLVDAVCLAGSNKNEDSIGYGKDFIFVIDGATGLRGVNIMGMRSDAEWFSKRLAEQLQIYLNNDSWSIQEILYMSLKQIREEYFAVLQNHPGIQPDYPSAGIVIFRERNGYLESFRLGDCVGVVRYKSGKIALMKEENLVKLDKYAIDCQVKMAKMNGISVREARPLINDVLIKNREKLNTPGGYWILEPQGVGIPYGEYRKFDLDKIESISCMSDGYFAALEVYKMMKNYTEFQDILINGGCAKVVKGMFTIQENDKDFNKYPRFKFRDDASAVVAKFKK